MTFVTLQDGSVVFRDGKVGTGNDCCCGCCCIDGEKDPSKKTQAACEAASGTWNAGVSCDDPCFCCDYRRLCLEKVESRVGPFAGPRFTGWFDFDWADDIPADQPEGTIRVFNILVDDEQSGQIFAFGCAGTSPGKQSIQESELSGWCYDSDPCGDGNFYFRQWYYRLRVVDSCDDCNNIEPGDPQTPLVTEEEMQFPDGYINCCLEDGVPPVDVADCEECLDNPPIGGRPTCNDWGTGCPINRVTAYGCFSLNRDSCDVRDQAAPTPPTFSDCVEAANVSLCENPLP